MLLTKENLLRFIREKKAVTPTMVSQAFETTTIIASATLSELANAKLLKISHLKIGSTPYYYDPNQKECLFNLAQNIYQKNEKAILLKLNQQKILPDNALSIPERLAITKIKDFAIPIEINYNDKNLKFWVWYLENTDKVKEDILNYIKKSNNHSSKTEKKITKLNETSSKEIKSEPINHNKNVLNLKEHKKSIMPETSKKTNVFNYKNSTNIEEADFLKIETFFKKNDLIVDTKKREEHGTYYSVSFKYEDLKIVLECYYFQRRVKESELIRFYTASLSPKIVFLKNPSKKIMKLSQEIKNLQIIEI